MRPRSRTRHTPSTPCHQRTSKCHTIWFKGLFSCPIPHWIHHTISSLFGVSLGNTVSCSSSTYATADTSPLTEVAKERRTCLRTTSTTRETQREILGRPPRPMTKLTSDVNKLWHAVIGLFSPLLSCLSGIFRSSLVFRLSSRPSGNCELPETNRCRGIIQITRSAVWLHTFNNAAMTHY